MTNVTYFVPNIHCGHCIHTIKMEVSELPGVVSVDANLDTRQVSIIFGSPATEEQIESLLAEINYPVAM